MAEEKNQPIELSQEQPDEPSILLPREDFPGSYGNLCGPNTVQKTWPELVGLTAEAAEYKIKADMPGAVIQVVPKGHFVTMDYRTNRVRIFIDAAGKVADPPRIG